MLTEAIQDKMYAIAITDNGVGIPSDKISTLFDQFAGSSTPGTAKEKGTGLGLPLCKEFADKNGGKLMVESQEGQGSTFTLLIPISK